MAVARKEKRKKRPIVTGRRGKYHFQTGMVTASLLHRGLDMTDAMTIARAVRDSVANREQISTQKLRARIDEAIVAHLGPELASRLRAEEPSEDAVPMVETARGRFPFSRGVVLRHLDTSGLGLDAAMEVVRHLERWVRAQKTELLAEERLQREVARLVFDRHGQDFARRYRLMDWVRRSDKPVVILIGGATGAGKSTLAMELAYRLGVVWVTSTDLIRETMRTVLSPELVPGLHDHSFRGIVVGGQVLSDPRERVLAGFRQQSSQVSVGVRAVIERALRESAHIIIEGTHLVPPFHHYVPAEADAHVAGFLLAVPDEKEHRERFPKRSKLQTERVAVTYLDAFQSVRWIHDDLLRMAEDAEEVVLPNLTPARTLIGAVDFLSRELPVDDEDDSKKRQARRRTRAEGVPTLFLILDGLADEPNPALHDETPLSAAHTPFLRRLAAAGGQGQVATARPGVSIPSTDDGILALLGAADGQQRVGRGLFEALGRGLPIPAGAIVLRGNLASAEADGALIDRRAGRIRAGVEDLLSELRDIPLAGGIRGRIYPGHEHRILIVLTGPGLSPNVSDTDPGGNSKIQRAMPPRPLDNTPEAGRTADALRQLLDIAGRKLKAHPLNAERVANGLLAANTIITRGAAFAPERRPPDEWLGAMVTGCNTALGVARYVGLKTATSAEMTGNLDTDLDLKFTTAGSLLEEQDFVVVHIKGTDVAAHDLRPLEKRDFISKVDAALGRFLSAHPEWSGQLRVVVSADHGTSSMTGNHLATPVPLLLATWQADNEEEDDFDEESSSRGALGILQSGELGELLGLRDRQAPASLRPPQR